MTAIRCTHCGSTDLEQGFVYTAANSTSGVGRWYSGIFERRTFTNFIRGKRERRQGAVITFRCTVCSHLVQFADLNA